jgi:hypothetical protein
MLLLLESVTAMELTLNLAWVVLAVVMVILWLRHARRDGHDRRMQLISLGVLLLILLPAISMTDDLVAAQNPAEIDCCLRRGHEYALPDFIFPALTALPVPAFAYAAPRVLSLLAPPVPSKPAIESSALASIQNRPPPVG